MSFKPIPNLSGTQANFTGSITIAGLTVATQSWVSSQNYLTSETDDQTLDEVLAQGNVSASGITVGSSTISGAGTSTFTVDSTNSFGRELTLSTNGILPTISANTDLLIKTSNNDTQIKLEGGSNTDNIQFIANEVEQARITTAGVGIGTTSPDSKLHAYQTISTAPSIVSRVPFKTNADAQLKQRAALRIDINEGGSSLSIGGIGSANSGFIQSYSTNSTSTHRNFVLNPFGGNVGIGTTSPSKKLDVAGDIKSSATVEAADLKLTSLSNQSSEATALVVNGSNQIGYRELGSAAFSATSTFATAAQGASADTAFGWGNHASAGYAPLASPALTGNPTAPTQSSSENSTKIATTAYVKSQGYLTSLSNALLKTGGTMSGAIAMGSNNITDGGSFFANLFSVGNEGKVVSTSSLGLQLQATAGSKPITFYTNVGGNTERMRITHDGNVGIGTTSPSELLTIAAENPTLRFEDISSSNYTEMYVNNFDTYLNTKGRLFIQNQGSTKVTVKSDGNVGIGTTSPTEKLHIESGNLLIKPNAVSASHSGLLLGINKYNSGKAGLWGATDGAASNTDGNIYISTRNASASNGSYIQLGQRDSTTASDKGTIVLQAGAYNTNSQTGDILLKYGITDTLTLQGSSGNVGIGTTSPSKKLDVAGDIKSEGLHIGTPYAGKLSIAGNFRHSDGDGLASLIYNSESSTGQRPSGLNIRAGVNGYNSYSLYVTDRNANPILLAHGNGNVGIGMSTTSYPSEKLEVIGNIKASGSVEIGSSSAEGVILTSPGGSRFLISINNSGELQSASL